MTLMPITSKGRRNPDRNRSRWREELNFASELLAGSEPAAIRFQSEIKPEVERFIYSKCWSQRSRNLASEVLEEVFAECFGGFAAVRLRTEDLRTPLLEKFSGHTTLAGWLKRVARNRLISRCNSSAESRRIHLDNNEKLNLLLRCSHLQGPAQPRLGFENVARQPQDEENPLAMALEAALRRLGEHQPDLLVVLELHYLFSVPKNVLARAWQVQPSTIGRRIERAITALRNEIEIRERTRPRHLVYGLEDYLEAGCIRKIACRTRPISARLAKQPHLEEVQS